MKNIFALVLLTSVFACAKTDDQATPGVKKSTNSQSSEVSLTLSWKVQKDIDSYHIFHANSKKGSREIDSVGKGEDAYSKGAIVINQQNLETWPKAGEKACFYVVAEKAKLKSDPSAEACITL